MFRRSLRAVVRWVAPFCLLLTLVACHPAVIVLPPHIHSVALDVVDNHTATYGLESLTTQSVLREFQTDGRLLLVTEKKADLLVRLSIRQYEREVLMTDEATNRPKQYRLSIQYDLSAIDQIDQKPLFEDKGRIRSVLYYTEDYPGAIVETEEQAIQRLSDDLATSLVRRVIEG